jgi:hypothetical protein
MLESVKRAKKRDGAQESKNIIRNTLKIQAFVN